MACVDEWRGGKRLQYRYTSEFYRLSARRQPVPIYARCRHVMTATVYYADLQLDVIRRIRLRTRPRFRDRRLHRAAPAPNKHQPVIYIVAFSLRQPKCNG